MKSGDGADEGRTAGVKKESGVSAVVVSWNTGSSSCVALVGQNCFLALDESYFAMAKL
jgi:hypothetical protein